MKTYAEKVDWSKFKLDIKANENDNNQGYIYGLFYIDYESGDIYECEWYKTEKERNNAISNNNISII